MKITPPPKHKQTAKTEGFSLGIFSKTFNVGHHHEKYYDDGVH
jgi:hypothetical protein